MKNTHKHSKIIITLVLSFCITSTWFIKPVMADSTSTTENNSVSSDVTNSDATNSNITSTDIKTLSEMTFDQLTAAAQPMPDNAITNSIIGDNNDMVLNSQQFIPQDGNIYYISSTFIDPITANYNTPRKSTTITYYKFLNTEPGRYPFVNYTSYYWEFKDGVLYANGTTTESVNNETLYKQLSGGLPYIPAVDTFQHKRLSTMFDMAEEINPDKLNNVVITSGTSFADALSGTVLASKLKAPIFFMNTKDDTNVYDYVNDNLKKGGTVYILGKEGAISSVIENKFTQYGFTASRLGGTDRYDTCSQINNQLNISKGTPVIIVSGENFPDALSISSVAACKGYPILLTQSNSIPQQTISQLNKINPSRIYVIGGPGVISDNIFSTLKNYSSYVSRIFGTDRYETSLNICKSFNFNNSSSIVLATGTDFKDALAGSTVAAKYDSPILLINSDTTKVKEYLKSSSYKSLIILGDTSTISTDTENDLAK
ncbi:cell wall-binding repeat-containing protein [Clostridium sp. WILCCON 0269]|uniref:Cell wall-binding repeat-containing protein n=1 Tax=Candidatus Clostridium eludens TaxID=3381663 RepID=A0ABW8SGE4_9CLOT